MSNIILVDGINGQDGSYLAKHLLEIGETDIIGITRRSGSGTNWRHEYLGISNKIKLEFCDITEPYAIAELIKKYQPKEYYHLAAQSFVKSSFDNVYSTIQPNIMGTLNILEAIKNYSLKTKLYNASSSEMYGRVKETPQDEFTPYNPVSPYGVSKLASHEMVRVYRESYNLFMCSGILFNHESPLRGKEFITKKLTSGLSKWVNTGETIKVGNLDAKRDWGHSKDYVEAMVLMLHNKEPKDYIVSTGHTYNIREFIIKCLKVLKVDYKILNKGTIQEKFVDKLGNIIVEVSEEFYRPNEVQLLKGNSKRIRKDLGWEPTYTIDTLIEDMLDYEWDV
jgi:GDPmannose 4,6-dehydratase